MIASRAAMSVVTALTLRLHPKRAQRRGVYNYPSVRVDVAMAIICCSLSVWSKVFWSQ
jgi:hypothetical protein